VELAWFARGYDLGLALAEWSALADWRARLLGGLRGRVLELGAGTGANLGYYPPSLDELVMSEPDPDMRAQLLRKLGADSSVRVEQWPAERLLAPDGHFDVVVATLVWCTVEDPAAGLREAHRVLRAGGQLVFLEHVRASGPLASVQRALEPAWKRVAGNCHLTRPTVALLREAGFLVQDPVEQSHPFGMPPFLWPIVGGIARK
jgi:SAM-dependent methyltransferase